MTELDRALCLSTGARMAMLERFFDAHPGGTRPVPGCGLALIDFLAWEIDSGRVVDGGGSPWWRAVNGFLVLDLVDAIGPTDGESRAQPTVLAWKRYMRSSPGDEQRNLWRAHEQSIARAVSEADAMLEGEEPAEQSFARLVLRVLSRATRTCEPTDTSLLGETVRRQYPGRYPISRDGLAELVTALSSKGSRTGPGT